MSERAKRIINVESKGRREVSENRRKHLVRASCELHNFIPFYLSIRIPGESTNVQTTSHILAPIYEHRDCEEGRCNLKVRRSKR